MDPWLDTEDPEAALTWLKNTFLERYRGNRVPFGIYTHRKSFTARRECGADQESSHPSRNRVRGFPTIARFRVAALNSLISSIGILGLPTLKQ